jgi:hypothetical protein
MRAVAQVDSQAYAQAMGRFLSTALLFAWQAHSQSTTNPPAFEVADIKPSDPSTAMPGKGRMLPGGRIEIPGMTVKNFIMFFKLAIHREDKAMPAYVLTVGKRTAKFHEGNGGRQECSWSSMEDGLRRRECHNLTMAEFVKQLPGWGGIGIDLPVVDQTGLKGAYDFQLEVGLPVGRPEGGGEGGRGGNGPSHAIADSGPTIFAALDQIGLKLESRKMPMPVIVVDHVEPPGN